MSARLSVLLLDAVGTLIRLREPAAAVYVRVAARHGLVRVRPDVERALEAVRIAPPPLDGVPLAEIPAHEREGWRAIVRAVLGEAASDGPCFDDLYAAFARPEAWQLIDGARDALRTARALGLRCAVVSNMDSRLPGVLAGLGVAEAIDAIVLPSSCGFAKPDPRIFAFALARLGVPADQALYVGDREIDCVASARSAGVHAWRLDPAAPSDVANVLRGWAELESGLSTFARPPHSG